MNTQLTADDELREFDDYEDSGEFETERPRSRLNLRSGGTDLFRGVLVALAALAVGALILTSQTNQPEAATTGDDQSSELSADDPTATSMAESATGESGAGAGDDSVMTDPATPATTDASATSVAGDATAGAAAIADATTASTSTSVAPEAAVRPPAEVEGLVLNATDRKGIAAQGTELLDLSDYATIPADNATSSMGSVIYYMDGYRSEALAVAAVFGDGLDGLVQAYDPASPPAEDIGEAKVIVILGTDDAIPLG